MWFLRGRPTEISVRAFIESISPGYQRTNFRFKIQAEQESTKDSKVWLSLGIPWSPNKENGSFRLDNVDTLSTLIESDNVQYLSDGDYEIYPRPRALKRSPDIELVHVQEMCQWYLDDIGVISFWANTDTWYQINYAHKIAADSALFFPTRLPTIVQAHNPKKDYLLWTSNVPNYSLPKQLVKLSNDKNVAQFKFKDDWDWGDDTRIRTNNWESSDDESDTTSEE